MDGEPKERVQALVSLRLKKHHKVASDIAPAMFKLSNQLLQRSSLVVIQSQFSKNPL